MTVDNIPQYSQTNPSEIGEIERDAIIKFLTQNKEICFKSQQKWESDLTREEKFAIGLDIFQSSKLQFLIKFGKYMKYNQLISFGNISENEVDFEEMNILVNDLLKTSQNTQNVVVRNRRYHAMLQMIQNGSYFSEIEMMKRNPLLYNQLVGQYLTKDEKKERDKYEMNSHTSFVKILMEGIERDNAEEVRQQEEEKEEDQMEDDCEPNTQPSTSLWGEFEGRKKQKSQSSKIKITFEEKKLLKDEFVTTMYESFLDGKDTDFNYDNIDNDTAYDDMDEINNDEEEKYFASEEVDGNYQQLPDSEDELDAYMNTLK